MTLTVDVDPLTRVEYWAKTRQRPHATHHAPPAAAFETKSPEVVMAAVQRIIPLAGVADLTKRQLRVLLAVIAVCCPDRLLRSAYAQDLADIAGLSNGRVVPTELAVLAGYGIITYVPGHGKSHTPAIVGLAP